MYVVALLAPLASAACAGSPGKSSPAAGADPAGPSAEEDTPWEGVHVLTPVLERGQATKVDPESFHISLALEPGGTYAIKEWENGRWQRQGAGAYERAGSRLRLLQVGPGVDMFLHARATGETFSLCMTASEEREVSTGRLVGKHTMVEKTSAARQVTDGMTMQLQLDDNGGAQVTTLDGEPTLTGRYHAEGQRLILEGGEGARVELMYWFDGGRLILCRDAFQSAAAGGG